MGNRPGKGLFDPVVSLLGNTRQAARPAPNQRQVMKPVQQATRQQRPRKPQRGGTPSILTGNFSRKTLG